MGNLYVTAKQENTDQPGFLKRGRSLFNAVSISSLFYFRCLLFSLFLIISFNKTNGQVILSQDFESAWTTASTLSPAWSSVGTGENQWQKNSYTTGWTNTTSGVYAPTGLGSCGTLGSARFHSYQAASNTTGDLITPTMDFSAAGTKTLTFWMINTSGSDKVEVALSTDNGLTYGAVLSTSNVLANWILVTVNLGTSVSTQCKVRFRATSDFGTTDIGIDRVTIFNGSGAMSGVYTIDNSIAASATNYTCFTTAITDLNEKGISASVTFNVKAAQIFTEDAPVITATGTATNTITFQRSGAGANPVIKPTGGTGTTDAGFTISGGDYFTFDGIDVNIASGSALEYGYYLTNPTSTNGAQNNVIKNTKVILNRTNTSTIGIFQAYTTTATSAAGANSGNKYYNFTIENSYNGIYLLGGSSTFPDLSSEIGTIAGGATIVGAATANDIGNGTSTVYGIRTALQQDVKIFNCEVRNVNGTSTNNVHGIYLETAAGTNTQIYNNKVHDITSTYTSTSIPMVIGIRVDVASGLTATVYNNFIYGLTQSPSSANSSQTVRGIAAHYAATTGTINFYYNTVRIATATANATSTAFYMQSGTVNLKNNIFSNFSPGGTTSKRYAAYISGGTLSTSDYNDLYVAAGTNNFTGYSTADQAALANWQTATSKDANSIAADPQFVSATNLHINTATNVVDGKGSAITGFASDIDGDARCTAACSGTSIPDIGADEFTSTVACPGTPTGLAAGSVTSTGASISFTCTTCSGTFVLEYGSVGFAPGSGASAGAGTVITAAGSPIAIIGLTANTTYDVYIRNNCSGSNFGANSVKISFTTPCGALNVPYTQNFDGVTVPAIPACMSTENVNADANVWQTCTATSLGNSTSIFPTSGTNQMGIGYNGSIAMNDWFYLPAINLTGGTSYRLSFYVRGYTLLSEQIEVKYGTSASAAGMTSGTIMPGITTVVGAPYTQKVLDFTPASTGVYYIGFHGMSAANKWYLFVDDISLTVTPATLTATALTAFGNVCTSTTAGPNSFTITGTTLTATNISVAALTGYTYSTTAGGTYTTSLSLPQSGGAYSQQIFVKFNPTLVQSYSGNIVVSGGGASAINVAASGSGVNSAPSVSAGAASGITTTGATVAGTISSTGCSAITAYGIEFSTTNGFANGSGTAVSSSNLSGSNFSSALSSLSPGTVYYFHAYATNGAGTTYSTQGTFTTLCATLNVPYTQNFDGVAAPAIPACMSVENTNADAYAWQTCTAISLGNGTSISPNSGLNQMGIRYSSSAAMNDWFYLPPINLTGGTSYRLTFYVRGYTGLTEQLEVKYGTSASSAAMTSGTIMPGTFITGGVAYSQKTVDFIPGSTGVYYVGFHGLSASNQWYLFVDDVSLTVTPSCTGANGGTATAATVSFCGTSGSTSISATGYTSSAGGLSYQWQSSPSSTFASSITDISGATNPALLNTGAIAVTTYYRLKVTCTLTSTIGYSNIVSVSINNPQILTTTDAARCGIGTVSLQATGSSGSTFNWYTAPSGGSPIGTGSPFTTPTISSSTNYYVAASAGGSGTGSVGPVSPTAEGGTISTQYVSWGVYFNVTQAITLQSVDIFPLASGETETLYVYNSSGTLLGSYPYTTTVSGGATAQTIPINLSLPVGTGYNIDASDMPTSGLSRNTSGAVYPYTSSAVNITGNAYDNTYFMCYYNWKFSTGCESSRTLVVATVTPPPALALSAATATICSGSNASVNVSAGTISNFSSYSWSPALGVTASGSPVGSIATLSPAATTTYTISGTNGAGCVNNATIAVAVNPAPPVVIGAAVCSGTNATISATSSCNNYTNPRTNISGGWNAATDPVAIQPVIFLPNSVACEFDPDGHTMNYTTLDFQVTVSGTYNFLMDNNTIDGMGYIVTGPFVPGYCPGTGTWVVGDDDTGPGLMPMMDATLVAGVTYTLITTAFSYSSGTNTGAYNWNITPPAGGQIVTGTTGSIQWWTAPTGGSVLGSGSPFNPVGVAGSGFPTNTTVGTNTYYAACSNNSSCRTPVGYTIGTTGQWTGANNSTWGNMLNWCGGVPNISTDATVSNGAPNMPLLSSGAGAVRNLTVNTGAALTVSNATLQIAGTISASNTITASAGTIEMAGSTAQAISGSSFTGRTLQNLIASNAVNVSNTANDTLRITGTLSFGNVNGKLFNSGDNVILVSSPTGTARVADITNNGVNSGNSFSGKFAVQRYFPGNRAWRLLTAPITAGAQTINQAWQEGVGGNWVLDPKPGYGTHITGGLSRTTLQGFDQGPLNASIYGYTGAAWSYLPANTSELVTSREGWMLFVRGSRAINLPASNYGTVPDNTILRPTGPIKFGSQPAVTNAAGGFTVIGNPYPSAIDFKTVSRSGVIGGVGGNAYYLWDPNLGGSLGQGAFVTFAWNGSTYDKTIVTGTGSSNITNTGIIPSSAAFMVNLNPGGSIGIAENNKSVDVPGPSYLFRPTTAPSSLRTSLYVIEADNSKAILDGSLINFSESASTAIDNEDAIKLNNFSENFSLIRDNVKIAIERRANITGTDTVFYAMWKMKPKNYELEIAFTSFNLPAGLQAWLEDNYLQQKIALNTSDTNHIAFAVTTDVASSAENRFRIVFEPSSVVPVTFTNVRAYPQNKNILVEWTVQNELNIQHYEVEKSADGIHFTSMNNTAASGGNAGYNWLDQHALPGDNFYRIKSIENTGRIQYSQVVKVRMGDGKPAISIYPNPVNNGIINVLFSNMPQGKYQANLYNDLGQLVLAKQITNAAGSSSSVINISKQLARGVYQLEISTKESNKETYKVIIE